MSEQAQSRDFAPEKYRSYLLVLARIQLRNQSVAKFDASDVVQDALLRAHRHHAQFQGNTEPQRCAWLKQILANVIVDAQRKLPAKGRARDDLEQSACRLESLLPALTLTPSQKVEKAEYILRLAAALEKLLPDERSAVELRYFHDWKVIDIAKHLDRTSTRAVGGLLARGMQKLRKALGDNK